jgi:inorganic pyrophosphatase
MMDEPAYPGCVVRSRAIGVLLAKKEGKENHRVIAVSTDAKTWSQHRDLTDLPRRLLREIEQFFHSIQNVDGREHALLGWRGASVAERVIDKSIEAETRRRAEKRASAKRGKTKQGPAHRDAKTQRKAARG